MFNIERVFSIKSTARSIYAQYSTNLRIIQGELTHNSLSNQHEGKKAD